MIETETETDGAAGRVVEAVMIGTVIGIAIENVTEIVTEIVTETETGVEIAGIVNGIETGTIETDGIAGVTEALRCVGRDVREAEADAGRLRRIYGKAFCIMISKQISQCTIIIFFSSSFITPSAQQKRKGYGRNLCLKITIVTYNVLLFKSVTAPNGYRKKVYSCEFEEEKNVVNREYESLKKTPSNTRRNTQCTSCQRGQRIRDRKSVV